jgi:class 3 adenylate cyclase/streptogramin lyase
MSELPHGTVTLLFTDVEGSTQLQHRLGSDFQEVVAEHRRLLESTFSEHRGVIVDRQTESFFVAFPRARDAIQAASDAQRALASHEWPKGAQVKVRMGIHSGDPELAGDRYVGLAVARAARICASAHGGQVLLSSAARALLSDHDGTALRGLGSYRLKDFDQPEPISQLVIEGLPAHFPPLRTDAAASRRPRWLILGGGALAAAIAAAIAVLVLTGGGGGVKVGPTSLAIVDPKTNKVVGAVDLGFRSNLIAAGEGYVWIVDPRGSTLTRVDPRTRVVQSFGIAVGAGSIPFGVAAGEGGVWVAVLRGTKEVVLELGPGVGDLRQTIHYGGKAQSPVLYRLQPLAVGGGAVCAIDPTAGGIWRIDPSTGRARMLAEGLDALSLASGAGAIWVAGSTGVTILDSVTGNVLGSTSIGSQSSSETASVALGSNAAWYAASSSDTLSKLDLRSASQTQSFSVGTGPSGVAVGEGAVWVANSGDGTLSRVDPSGGAPRVVRTGQIPGGIVAAYGFVWASPGEPRS